MSIAVIGSANIDLVTYINRMPVEGETIEAPDFRTGPGGKGANQAVAAARLGADVAMVARVGTDIFGETILDNLASSGVDISSVMTTDGPSGVATILVSPNGNNSIMIVAGANGKLSPADIDACAERLRECDIIVLQLEVPLETVYAAIEFGAANDIPVLLNPAPAHPDLDISRLGGLSFLVPNETELELLTGMPVQTVEQIEDAAQKLLDIGVPHVLVTLGSKGVLHVFEGGMNLIPATRVKAEDSTGAGDAFIGCFSHYWSVTGDVERSIRAANSFAGDSVTRRGAQESYASLNEFVGRFPEEALDALYE